MGDYVLKYLRTGVGRFKTVGRTGKKNSIFIAIILMLAMSIFFCVFSEKYAYANKSETDYSHLASFKPEYVESISELRDIDLKWDELTTKEHCPLQRTSVVREEENELPKNEKSPEGETCSLEERVAENLGVMNDWVTEKSVSKDNGLEYSCDNNHEKGKKTGNNQREGKMLELVVGYPIEEMLPHIAARNEKVAYYLVAIAKKESDWGKHSPRKNGGTCYNYWGYRGTYNQTASGYSCFDSPEQAIRQVGDRIEALLDKMIDTPEEMIVWKCGSTCAGHDPQGVLKWISDVKLYYNKLQT